jgi:hypothetical protein
MHNFTSEDLIQYLYKETSPEKTAAIGVALLTDWSLREKLDSLNSTQSELNDFQLVAPRSQSIEHILAYAEKSVEEFSENV